MDFKENQTRPKSIHKLLLDQVEEQSDMCDVTVKVDNWKKKFHRCVLIQSPFFECVFRHEYKETQTGKIEINLGTPATVKMAIMFLYGKKPILTMDNAEIMIALAEYFFIPNLKATCVAWLQAVEVNEENCMKLIEIASLFNIDLYKCMEFAKGRLDILFGNEQFTRIDSDSVKYIFTERGLSYISMDDKLKFLVKWTQVDPINRLESAKDCAKLLDFRDNSREMLKQVVNDPIFRDITEDKVPAETTADEDSRHEVLIIHRSHKIFWCLDLTRNKWFKLDSSTLTESTLYSYFDILGVQNSESNVYFLKSLNIENKIVCLDLETSLFTTFSVVQTDDLYTPKKRINEVRMYADVCIIKDSGSVLINKKIKVGNTKLRGRQRRIGLKSELRYEERVRIVQLYMNTSTVYVGKVVNDRIETKPLFTFLNGNLSKMCMNNLFSVAFIDEKGKRIILYDIKDCKLEIIQEPTIHAYGDEICCAENGFVVFNNTRCIYLVRQEELALDTKYQKKKFEFAFSDTSSIVKLYFLNDRWYRYFRNRYEDTFEFEWTSHHEMLAAKSKKNVHWTPLPLPLDANCRSDTLNKQMFHIRLHKSKLRCDIECPHCNRQNNEKPVSQSLSLYRSNIRNYHYTPNYGEFSYEGNYDYSDNDDYPYYYDYSDYSEYYDNGNDWFD